MLRDLLDADDVFVEQEPRPAQTQPKPKPKSKPKQPPLSKKQEHKPATQTGVYYTVKPARKRKQTHPFFLQLAKDAEQNPLRTGIIFAEILNRPRSTQVIKKIGSMSQMSQ